MIHVLLYDADGADREITLDDPAAARLDDRRLLWVDAVAPTDEDLRALGARFRLHRDSLAAFVREDRRPRLDSYGDYFQFDVDTIEEARAGDGTGSGAHRAAVHAERLHVVCGERFVVTVHRAPLAFLELFRRQDKGETRIGTITGPALAVSLLDWHLGAFFDAVEGVEDVVDELEDAMLAARHGSGSERATLRRLAALRGRVATLRRLLSAQREVVYGLSRPDFAPIVGDGVAPHLQALGTRFDRALDAAEAARDQLLGSFDLLATRTTQETNELVQTLTFVTLLLGALGVIAGVFGMNFPIGLFAPDAAPYAELAFVAVLLGMALLVAGAILAARRRGWLSHRQRGGGDSAAEG